MDLPSWLDAPKIAGLVVLVLAVVQYFKTAIPEKFIKYFAMGIGILLAIAADLYIGTKIVWIRSVMNGVIASILADTAYGFLSQKSGSFTLPSKPQNGTVATTVAAVEKKPEVK